MCDFFMVGLGSKSGIHLSDQTSVSDPSPIIPKRIDSALLHNQSDSLFLARLLAIFLNFCGKMESNLCVYFFL